MEERTEANSKWIISEWRQQQLIDTLRESNINKTCLMSLIQQHIIIPSEFIFFIMHTYEYWIGCASAHSYSYSSICLWISSSFVQPYHSFASQCVPLLLFIVQIENMLCWKFRLASASLLCCDIWQPISLVGHDSPLTSCCLQVGISHGHGVASAHTDLFGFWFDLFFVFIFFFFFFLLLFTCIYIFLFSPEKCVANTIGQTNRLTGMPHLSDSHERNEWTRVNHIWRCRAHCECDGLSHVKNKKYLKKKWAKRKEM